MADEADNRRLLRRAFDAAVAAAGLDVDGPYWPDRRPDRILAFGKAAPAMLQCALARYPDCPAHLVTSDAVDCAGLPPQVEVLRASHPVPDTRSEAAAQRFLELAGSMASGEHLLVLASGGGSALLAAPVAGLTLADKAELGQTLLSSGASISEMNTVRAAVSLIKAGGLARAAAPARVTTLVVSDVPGDDPSMVASGPTVPSGKTAADALAVLDRYEIGAPRIRAALAAARPHADTPTGDVHLAASAGQSLAAARTLLQDSGLAVIELGDDIEGEAREVARADAHRVAELASGSAPLALLAGGETTVTISAEGGRGGRNSEYALALALALEGRRGVYALAADTDGIDGIGPHAGAFVSPGSLARMVEAGIDPHVALDGHNSATAFETSGDLLVTGATGTNVNDFRLILITDPGEEGSA